MNALILTASGLASLAAFLFWRLAIAWRKNGRIEQALKTERAARDEDEKRWRAQIALLEARIRDLGGGPRDGGVRIDPDTGAIRRD